ncbi:hypothetical protein DE146DRAFT_258794 [Phaeosphaeria sp. MPI-PUGE-AT-0046c]|nr:hypothetical protein DE146DRAFT_258794 [Phaeosphaeria sp. MPI-PUGE-AT-0046c]
MRLLRIQQALSVFTCVSALAVRDSTATLNETALPSEDAEPPRTQSRQYRPHQEATRSDGFGSVPTTITSLGRDISQTTTPPDIGSVIQSVLTKTLTGAPAPVPSVHTEKSESGWEVVTQKPLETPSQAAGPHWEMSTDGFGPHTNQVPGPGATPGPYTPRPVVTPPPTITQGGIIFTPVPVTSVRVTTVDGQPTTLGSTVNYSYVVGTATIPINSPTIINNVPVMMSIDAAGSTILVTGSQTTKLPPPPQAAQTIRISTMVTDGTTKYVIGDQTLAPNQAITIGNVPISIGANGAKTVLVMGDLTTTFAATTTKDWGPSSAATPGSGSAATSAKSAAASAHNSSWVLAKILAIAAIVRPLI